MELERKSIGNELADMRLTSPHSRGSLELAEAHRIIAELRARDALKTQFLSNISHDLRTPLTAIITHAEILRDGILGSLNDRQQNSVLGVINGGRQLLDMVGEILTYAKGTAGQLTLSCNEFKVEDLVDQVFQLNETLAIKKGLQQQRNIASGIPAVHADRDKVMHILSNLVGNAIDFTPPGGRIWVNAACDANDLTIEVGDTGIGIAEEHHDLIFREFAQVDSSPSRAHHGTGLGLTIARTLVELHRGRIWLESKPGEGSRFFFAIPLKQKD